MRLKSLCIEIFVLKSTNTYYIIFDYSLEICKDSLIECEASSPSSIHKNRTVLLPPNIKESKLTIFCLLLNIKE